MPAEAEPPSVAGQEPISDLFWSVARRLRGLSKQALAPWDVAPSHGRALAVLLSRGDLRLSELSEHLHIAPRSTTEVVDALVERGLAERRPDPEDRRAVLVRLTEHGRAVATAIRAARATEAEAFFEVLDDGDRAALARILRRLQA
ncbi:MAG TPA: MarR family winged helix-turn-helix transcriptional regulator [Kineosporiaceae bacterium]